MEFTTYRLRDICEVKSGKRLPDGGEFSNEITSYPYIRARDIKNGIINKNSLCYISHDVYERIKRYIINQGDIAITIVANIGDVGYCEKELDGANLTENAVRLTNFKKGINTRYLTYYLSQPFFKSYMEGLAAGAAQAKLGIYKVNKIKVTIPSIKVQNTINSVISNYDELIENNNKRIKLLEQMAEELYKEWFVRFRFPGYEKTSFVDGIPEGWTIQKAGERYKITIGKTPPRAEPKWFTTSNEGVDWSSIADMRKGMFLQNTSEKLTFEAMKKFHLIELPRRTIIVSFKLTVGLVAITTKTITTSNEAIAHFLANKEEFEYLYMLLKMYNYSELGNTSSIGNAINSKIIKKMMLLFPNNELLILFHRKTCAIFDEIENLFIQNQKLILQRDSLLPRLMSGKIDLEDKEVI